MLQSAKKMLAMALTACLAAAGAVAAAEGLQADKVFQPRALNHAGINALRQIDSDLTGSGVKFAVICRSMSYANSEPQNDYRPNIEHNCFRAEQFAFHDRGSPLPSISLHSTAICSILFGEDTNAFNPHLGHFYYQGVAPQARADVYEFWYFLIHKVFGHRAPDADVVVAGFGWQFEDWWTRGIESLAEHYGLLVVAGIGNGSRACDPPLYPGAAANVIGVGVVDSVHTENPAVDLSHFSLAYPEHSSLGPTADGRCKPDIVAPGYCLAADAHSPDSYEPTGNCSSFSTPVVAGTIGLLVQKAKQQPSLSLAVSPRGGNCVMKAILMNSATKLPYWHKGRLPNDDDHVVPLDYLQGAGMLNAVRACKQLIAGRAGPGDVSTTGWDLNQLDKSDTLANIYKITIAEPSDKIITATIVWNRHYNNVYPFKPVPEKDANLRLELWAVDSANSSSNYLLDYSDSSVDNVEHIYCRADARYTNYEIVVSFSSGGQPQMDDTQRFGLAWNVSESHDSDSIFWHDLNADGIVNELDFAILLENWVDGIKSPESYLLGDINTDGKIDMADLQVFFDHNNRQADWYAGQGK